MSQVGVWANGYLKHLLGTIRASLVVITECLFQVLPQIGGFPILHMLHGFWIRVKRAGLNFDSAFLSDTSFSISVFYIDRILLDLVATGKVLLLCIMQKFVYHEGKCFGKLIHFSFISYPDIILVFCV